VIEGKSYKVFRLKVNRTVNSSVNLNYLEHVVSVISLSGGVRGKLEIYLRSPANTKSILLEQRSKDLSKNGFVSWPFMSVHFWGERPEGEWTLQVVNNGNRPVSLTEWYLKLFGVEYLP
jgi:subtilisin-like proprotein convertase family protein